MKGKLIFVSNRLPVTAEKKKGKISFKQSVGGLATGLSSFHQSGESLWIGWGGEARESFSTDEYERIKTVLSQNYKSYPVSLTRNDIKQFYHGFCNKTIWPLFHYFPNHTVYDPVLWEAYRRVNIKYCEAVVENADSDDTIWVHDYQLLLLPKLTREKLPKAKIGFFLHIPFPSFEIFRLLPWRKEILEGLLGADLVGFHTYDYVRHFLSSVRRLLGYEHTLGQVQTLRSLVKTDVFPMGIDYEKYANAYREPKVEREIERVRKKLGGHKVIISIDRLDYTKGILQRLEAFDHFLRTNPDCQGNVTLVLVAVPSRTGVETYMRLKKELDEQVGKLNGKYGNIGWMPVWYLYRSLPFHTLSALYHLADVALVTPLRDGMNLIAKEYIAAKGNKGGVLILSGMAGAVHELSESLVVNPHNTEQVSYALKQALMMPPEEQVGANKKMQDRIRRYDINRWAEDFIGRLEAAHEGQNKLYVRKLTSASKKKIVYDYCHSSRRLFLLDYDGTLTQFVENPDKAKPDIKLLSLLNRLVENVRNEIVIISGRDRESLSRWFKSMSVSLVAEHGVWIKERGKEWIPIRHLRDDWKDSIRPVFEVFMDRTPGSFIEEKDYSLVWHYRMADPDLASVRVVELRETLLNLTENLNVGILDGSKVIEVKTAGINKGTAVLHWLSKRECDFILAVGDDVTDENTFEVLPPEAYSVKVGLEMTKARYSVLDVQSVLALIDELSRAKEA